MGATMTSLIILVVLAFALAIVSAVGYRRPPPRGPLSRSLLEELDGIDSTTPHQVHVSLSGADHMKISWITTDPTPPIVYYGLTPQTNTTSSSTTATTTTYNYILYRSGNIHHVVIGPLRPDTLYYYRCGAPSSPPFTFKTPPSHFPIHFAITGDLGQTEWTRSTLEHIGKSKYDVLLLAGDLSYADMNQNWWDSFGQLVQPLATQRPWMVSQGNHEVERIPLIHTHKFTAYNARWAMPFAESGSTSNLYYSFEAGGVHVVMLGSYADFEPGSDQYRWLEADLKKVNRSTTPWVVAVVHAPWYNTNETHQGEYEATGMKEAMEELLFRARVDAVFAGHVHAYERFVRVYKDEANECGPMYITIGDGGNREGLATRYIEPQAKISAFREASFGHGHLSVVNGTHALWTWHRNEDSNDVVAADHIWLTTLASLSSCS